jgi:hypothetical protein
MKLSHARIITNDVAHLARFYQPKRQAAAVNASAETKA